MMALHRAVHVITAVIVSLVLAVAGAGSPAVQAVRVSGGPDWRTIIDSDFAGNTAAGWPTGNSGTYSERVGGGRYTLSVIEGTTQVDVPRGLLDLMDGQVTAIVRIEGRGRVGIAARMNKTADTGYTFWIDGQGRCGADRLADGTVSTLFALYEPSILPAGDNTLVLQMHAGMLSFIVNGHWVYRYADQAPLPAGAWGIVVESAPGEGLVQGHYAHVRIAGRLTAVPQATLTTGPFQAMIDYDFALGDNYSWGTRPLQNTDAYIAQGRLTVKAVARYERVVTPVQFPTVTDGQIDAVVRMEGAGRVGVVARWQDTPGSYFTQYAFWIDNRGDVGFSRSTSEDLRTVFEVYSKRVHPFRDNLVVLRVQGAHVSCYVNDLRVFVYTDKHPLAGGGWGAYVSDYPGGPYVQGAYAHILIAD